MNNTQSDRAIMRWFRWSELRRRRRVLAAVGGVMVVALVFAVTQQGDSADSASPGEAAEETIDTVLTLDSASLALAELEFGAVGTAPNGGLTANGTITYDANRVSIVAPRTEGRLVSVRTDLGALVRPGIVLALVESREVGQTRGELESARAGLEVARNNYDREKRLYEQSISSQKEMLEAQGAYRIALAQYNSTVAQMSGIGAGRGQGGVYGLTTPVAGTVVERNATPGQIVGPSTNLFTVADLRRVWIAVDVYESDLARVRVGAPAVISPRGFPGESFRGRVTYAGGVVDPGSRTLKVRVEVDNPGLRLRPGMYAQVRIEAPPGTSLAAGGPLVVPELAVQDLNGRSVVFVRGNAPGRFIARTVTVASRAREGYVTVTDGVRLGETIVTKGAFHLRAELLKGTFGDDD